MTVFKQKKGCNGEDAIDCSRCHGTGQEVISLNGDKGDLGWRLGRTCLLRVVWHRSRLPRRLQNHCHYTFLRAGYINTCLGWVRQGRSCLERRIGLDVTS